jgi:hypothetical protein
MLYILDFDHTLFDTDRFKSDAMRRGGNEDWVRPAIWDQFDATQYLYSDTLPFLESVGVENAIILTAMSPHLGPQTREFQKMKLERSGVRPYVKDIIFMEGDKGSYVADLCAHTQATFVDDTLDHLRSVQTLCPEVSLVHMVRTGSRTLPNNDAIPMCTALRGCSFIEQTL